MANTLARFSSALAALHRAIGVRAFLRFVRNTYSGRWLDAETVRRRMLGPFQLRFT